MKNISILPADTYTVVNKTVITDKDKKIVSMLYQPIIGYSAVSLYYTLISDLDKRELFSEDLMHHHLMATMQLSLEDIIVAREKLEAIGLIKTYMKKDNINQYVYLVYSPLDANDFFNHPILNIVLYNNVGKREYDKLLDYFKTPRVVLKDYQDITASFDEVFTKFNVYVLVVTPSSATTSISKEPSSTFVNAGTLTVALLSFASTSKLTL